MLVVNFAQDNEEKSKRRWYHRLFKPAPEQSTTTPKATRPRNTHRRSASELAYLIHNKRDPPAVLDIQSMIRLSGKSILYLPTEYTPCALIVPTCIRATAQYLEQHTATRGLFRVPGSVKVVGAIFDYYCHMEKGGQDIAGTVHRATLPVHIPYSTHDIASVFKRLLSVLPGGILGSLSLFDAFVAIHSQLAGVPEFPRTKQTKIRARLIALAIGTVKSQYQRELICAVMGLLSHIGRVAEVAPREDDEGRPLPTTDLMGYAALGIVFGPLLINSLMEQYVMKLAVPEAGMVVLPSASQRIHRERQTSHSARPGAPVVDKILIANDIAEMLISNWRDVVRQMKVLGTHHLKDVSSSSQTPGNLKTSASDTFVMRLPQGFEQNSNPKQTEKNARTGSPEPVMPDGNIRRARSRTSKPRQVLIAKPSLATLSPTPEEDPALASHTVIQDDEIAQGKFLLPATPTISKYSHSGNDNIYSETVPPQTSRIGFHQQTPNGEGKVPRMNNVNTLTQPNVPQSYREERRRRLLKASSPGTPTRVRHNGEETIKRRPLNTFAIRSIKGDPEHDLQKAPYQETDELNTVNSLRYSTRDIRKNNVDNQPLSTPIRQTQPPHKKRPTTDPVQRGRRNVLGPISQPLTTGPVSDTKASVRKLAALFENQNPPSPSSPSWKSIEDNVRRHRQDKPIKENRRIIPAAPPNSMPSGAVDKPLDATTSPSKWWKVGRTEAATARVLRPSVSEGTSLRLKRSQEPAPGIAVPMDHVFEVSDVTTKASLGEVKTLIQMIEELNDNLTNVKTERNRLAMEVNKLGTQHQDCQDEIEQARKEVVMWKRRAESAERKNKVFEKFTARLRGIRDSAVAQENCGGADGGADKRETMPHVRFVGTSTPVHEADSKQRKKPMHESAPVLERPGAEEGNNKFDNMYGEVAALWMAAKDVFDGTEG